MTSTHPYWVINFKNAKKTKDFVNVVWNYGVLRMFKTAVYSGIDFIHDLKICQYFGLRNYWGF